MGLRVNDSLTIPESELETKFGPSGGPGGQHANRAHTRCDLTWNAGESKAVGSVYRKRINAKIGPVVRVSVDDERSQSRNRDLARERLAQKVAEAVKVPKKRRATKPSKGSKRRRVASKRKRSETKKLRRKPTRDD